MKLKRKDINNLAKEITDLIFTPGGLSGVKADQIRLYRKEDYICGWGYQPARNAVEEIIKAFLRDKKTSK